jgi:hypothetical protein
MNPSLVLTLFLAVAGVLVFWGSWRNLDWFFKPKGSYGTFVRLAGRPVARVCYLVAAMGMIGWAGARLLSPPREIPTGFLHELATPQGIGLTNPREAVVALRQVPGKIRSLQTDASGWVSFWTSLDPAVPYLPDAVASTQAGPDFPEGFAFRRRALGEMILEGRILYFDTHNVSCDHGLFSRHPLDSAVFALIICTPEASRHNGFGNLTAVFYCRAGSPLYQSFLP